MLLKRKDPLAAFHCISLTSEGVTSFLCLLNIHVFSSINFVPILCLVFFHIKFFYLLFHIVWKWTFFSQLVKNPPACRRPRFNSWAGKICWRRDRLITSVFLGFPCGSAEKESACNAGDQVWSLAWEDSLEKGKATHSSILAWRFHEVYIPWSCKELDTTEQLSLHATYLNL